MVRVSVETCFRIYFSFCDLFIFIAYGFMGASLGSSVLVELHAILLTMKSSVPLPGYFLRGSVYPVKTIASLCFSLK